MGNGEREDENRRLAEWLGYVPHAPSEATNKPYLLWRSPMPPYDYLDRLPDFRTDEAANAMLLEKMPKADLRRTLNSDKTHRNWVCYADSSHLENPGVDRDRKTCIVLAALALLNERGQG